MTISTPVRHTAAASARRDAGQHQTRRMRADHDRKPAKAKAQAMPCQRRRSGPVTAAAGREQRIDEIGEHRGPGVVQVDCLEQAVQQKCNKTRMPIEMQRTRTFAGTGAPPRRSHTAMKASPITLRNDSMVSTSQCDAATIFTSTSDAPSTAAAAIPGAEAKTKRKAKGMENPVNVRSLRHTSRRCQPQPSQ